MHERGPSRNAIALAGLALLLGATGAAHLGLMEPRLPAFIGDETHHLKQAVMLADRGKRTLVPGRLGIRHRPPLTFHVFAYLAAPNQAGRYRYKASPAHLFYRLRYFHLGLLLTTLVCLYLQGRLLQLGPVGSLVPPTLLAVSPWFGFHVHAAWGEPLRTCLIAVAFTFVLAFLRSQRLAYLVPAGLVAAYAVFARSSLLPFMLVAIGFLAASTWVAWAALAPGRRALRAAAAGALFAGVLFSVLGPQFYVNWKNGHGLRLSTSVWRNIDPGLRGPPGDREWWAASRKVYFDSARTYEGREAAARARALAYLSQVSIPSLVQKQFVKLGLLATQSRSFFEHSVDNERWGPEASARLRPLVRPSRLLWYGLLALAALGLATAGWRSAGWLFVSMFALYFLAGLFIAGSKIRLVIPLIPTLCLLAGGFFAFGAPPLLRRAWPGTPGPSAREPRSRLPEMPSGS